MMRKRSLALLAMAGCCCQASQARAFVPADLERLLKTNECPKCDLRGAVLASMDLHKAKLEGADLSGADLTKASLRMADMAGVNLSGALLTGTIFEAADLFQADLTGILLSAANFSGAYLAGVKVDASQQVYLSSLQPAAVSTSSPVAATTADAVPETVSATEGVSSLTAQSLVAPQAPSAETPPQNKPTAGAEVIATQSPAALRMLPPPNDGKVLAVTPTDKPMALELPASGSAANERSDQYASPAPAAAPLEDLLAQAMKRQACVECNFSGMQLGNVSMQGFYLERANFARAQVAGANFKEANLKSAIFAGANLQGSSFRGADLYLADFSGANLSDADLRGASMDGARLDGAVLTGAKLDDSDK